MPATNKLNSLFLRWNGALGIYQGAQCTRFVISSDDAGRELFRGESAPFPVTEAGAADGYLLSQVIGEATTALLVAVETKDTEIAALKAAAKPTEDALAAANAQVVALTAQLAALQPPTDENGVPQVVTMVQAQLALLGAGLLDKVDTAIASIPGDQGRAAQIEWSKAANVHRHHALIEGMKGALELTDEQIDALFVAAAKL